MILRMGDIGTTIRNKEVLQCDVSISELYFKSHYASYSPSFSQFFSQHKQTMLYFLNSLLLSERRRRPQ